MTYEPWSVRRYASYWTLAVGTIHAASTYRDSPVIRAAHSNLFESWARGEYVPLLYSDEAVEAAVAQRILVRAGAE